MEEMTLKIVTASGSGASVRCDSVHLTLCDDARGLGGGSYGIRPGHAKTLFSLADGPIAALLAGRTVLAGRCGGGFAAVEQNTVTVVTERYMPDGSE